MEVSRPVLPVRVGGATHRPLLDNTLVTNDVKKAREELNEISEEVQKHIHHLREHLSREAGDLRSRTDDEFLLKFLRARKFDDQRALRLIKDHYRYRKKHPILFRRPRELEPLLRRNIFGFLQHRDKQGRAVFLMKIRFWSPEEFGFGDFMAAGNLLAEFAAENPVTQINGFVGIWDFKDYAFRHFSNSCTPRFVWMLCSLMQECFPGRFKRAYCVNCPPLADVVWRLFKPFIREKYRNRIVVIGNDMKTLHRHFHPSVLPAEYGGDLPNSDCNELVDLVLDHSYLWDMDRKYGYVSIDDPLPLPASYPPEEECPA